MNIIKSELIEIRHKNFFVKLSCGEHLWLDGIDYNVDILTDDMVLDYLCGKVKMVSMFTLNDDNNEIDVFIDSRSDIHSYTRLFTIKNPTQEQIDIVKDEYQLEDKELIRKVLKDTI